MVKTAIWEWSIFKTPVLEEPMKGMAGDSYRISQINRSEKERRKRFQKVKRRKTIRQLGSFCWF